MEKRTRSIDLPDIASDVVAFGILDMPKGPMPRLRDGKAYSWPDRKQGFSPCGYIVSPIAHLAGGG